MPKSTSSNWLREVARWTPNLTAYKFHGNQQEREQQKKVLGTHDVTITTYEMVIREKSALRKINWRYLCMKNSNSPRTHTPAHICHSTVSSHARCCCIPALVLCRYR